MNVLGSHEYAKTSNYNTKYFAILNVAGVTHKLSIIIQKHWYVRKKRISPGFFEKIMAIVFVNKISVLLIFVVLLNTHSSLP